MKNALLVVVLLAVGCGSLHEEYVNADAATLESIGPEYEALVKSKYHFKADGVAAVDSNGKPLLFSDRDTEFRLRTLRLWKARVDEAKALIAKQKEQAGE